MSTQRTITTSTRKNGRTYIGLDQSALSSLVTLVNHAFEHDLLGYRDNPVANRLRKILTRRLASTNSLTH